MVPRPHDWGAQENRTPEQNISQCLQCFVVFFLETPNPRWLETPNPRWHPWNRASIFVTYKERSASILTNGSTRTGSHTQKANNDRSVFLGGFVFFAEERWLRVSCINATPLLFSTVAQTTWSVLSLSLLSTTFSLFLSLEKKKTLSHSCVCISELLWGYFDPHWSLRLSVFSSRSQDTAELAVWVWGPRSPLHPLSYQPHQMLFQT